METKEMYEKLIAPFSFEEIGWRVGSTFVDKNKNHKAIAVPYLTRDAVQNRLDEVFGFHGWKNEYKEWGPNAQLCGISFKLSEDSEWITKWDGAGNTDYEGIKGGLSDSFKRTATVIGIGRYLTKLNTAYVDVDVKIKNNKESYSICNKDLNDTLPYFYQKEISRLFKKSTTLNPVKNTPVKNTPVKNTPVKNNDNNEVSAHIIDVLEQLIHAKRVDINSILNAYKVNSISDLTVDQVNNAMSRLAKTTVA